MGLRSGAWPGHCSVLTLCSSIHTLIDVAVWHWARKKTQSSELGKIVRTEGSKISSRITLYMKFIYPSQKKPPPFQPCWSTPGHHNPPPHFTVGVRRYVWSLTIKQQGDRKAENWTKLRRLRNLTPGVCGPIVMVFSKLQLGSSGLLIDEGLFSLLCFKPPREACFKPFWLYT